MSIGTVQKSTGEDSKKFETVCFHQGDFMQLVAASKCDASVPFAQRRWQQKKSGKGLRSQPSSKFSATLFPPNVSREEDWNMPPGKTQGVEEYEPKKFVNREKELAMIDERVLALRRREFVSQTLVSFWGVADIGKTWLLKEIEHRYQYDPTKANALAKPTCALYYDFSEHEQTVTAVLHQLITTITTNLSQPLLTDERKQKANQLIQTENVKESLEFILSLASDLVLIILLDTTESVNDEAWQDLEVNLLEPLLKSNKILLIGTGRNRVLRWKRVEVRRRATPIEKSEVSPFDLEATAKQLKNLGLSQKLTQELYDDSAGTPGLTTKLSHRNLELSEKRYREARVEEWNAYVEDIFEHLSQLPASFRQMITAVAPLRYYRSQALRLMLEKTTDYSDDTSDVFLLRALRKLDKKSHLVWWDDHHNAYVTAVAARRILNRHLQIENPTRFIELHSFALEMYREWAKEFQTSMPAYFPELLFHEATIYKSQRLEPDNKITVQNYLNLLDTMSPDNLDILQRRLNKDEELQDLVPKLYKQLLLHLEQLLEGAEAK
ncbi:MAG: hypothetical protein H6654_10310 [Ardenticatenaceae bacterium]|nr:hypothetical protein [Anaerolineales bacterium]MCB8938704.1 hypothetical protein [Ardenticatenaceae bacterium]MCB8973940.1 hypothetical protein [Ardenticatenaceae bacterium]